MENWQLQEENTRLRQQNYELQVAMSRRDMRGDTIKNLLDLVAQKNRVINKFHFIWCGASCKYSHRSPEPVTLEVVELAEQQARRLRRYYERWVASE